MATGMQGGYCEGSGDGHLAMTELGCSCRERGSCEALLKAGVSAALAQEVQALACAQQGFREGRGHEGWADGLVQSEPIAPQAAPDTPLCAKKSITPQSA